MTQETKPLRAPTLLEALSNGINTLCEAGLFLTLTLMTVVTIAQIIFRIFFKALPWSEEATCFLLVFASFLGSAVAFKRGSNIAVTFILNMLPAPVKKAMMIAIEICGIAFFAVTAWYGAVLCIHEKMQMASSMPISMGFIYMVFPITGLVTMLHLASHVEILVKYGISEEGGA